MTGFILFIAKLFSVNQKELCFNGIYDITSINKVFIWSSFEKNASTSILIKKILLNSSIFYTSCPVKQKQDCFHHVLGDRVKCLNPSTMEKYKKRWPRVPSGQATPSNSSSVGSSQFRGAKNPWESTSCYNTKGKNQQAHVTTLHDDTKIYHFYEDIEKAMASHKATHTLIIGDFNAKIVLYKTNREHVERDVEAWKEKTVQCVIEKHRGPKVFCKALQSGNHQITKIKDMNCVLATDRAKILKVIENYYQVLYSPMTEQPSNINRSKIRNIGSEEIPDIDRDEIWNALSKVKSGKTGGEDGIVPEMLKEGGESLIAELADLFNWCLSEGNIPKNWENAIVILLYKKGCKADLNNYRPISLLSQTYKLFSKILTNRVTRKLDFYQPREQAGFRQGYSTIDHILAVRVLIEKSTEYQIPIWLAFVDYKKAFDSVETWAVSESLRNARVDNRYINIIESIYSNATLKVAIPYHTKPVKIQRGSARETLSHLNCLPWYWKTSSRNLIVKIKAFL
ncbi:hypothetical protein ABMA28_010105 [Loxostege sticticalis]|uniref:Reverse transcriptase domain-containing protein n=1 Tax=Loxostege sticticalis TaxID=481309 RepID=A0ABD0SBV1_LOXSC